MKVNIKTDLWNLDSRRLGNKYMVFMWLIGIENLMLSIYFFSTDVWWAGIFTSLILLRCMVGVWSHTKWEKEQRALRNMREGQWYPLKKLEEKHNKEQEE